jgi:hypothetical protein
VPYGALRGGVPSEQGSTALVMAPQCVGWLHRAWDGRTESEVTGGRAPLTLRHDTVLGECRVGGRMLLEGVVVPFRWVRHGGRTGAGGMVSNNVTSHHA